jgi:hypothetical protein
MRDRFVIITQFWCRPMPNRQWDWCAYRDDYGPDMPLGSGETERAAILDLLRQEEEEQCAPPYCPKVQLGGDPLS